jgi:hypothetical protein
VSVAMSTSEAVTTAHHSNTDQTLSRHPTSKQYTTHQWKIYDPPAA